MRVGVTVIVVVVVTVGVSVVDAFMVDQVFIIWVRGIFDIYPQTHPNYGYYLKINRIEPFP